MICLSERGSIRIRFFNEEVTEITYSPDGEWNDFSYAVIAQPGDTQITIEDDAHVIRIMSSGIHVHLQKHQGTIAFRMPDGSLLNEDEPGLPASYIGTQVTCYKKLQDGERFIGLGEKTGALDRRGHGYQNWNTDAYSYHAGTDPLYCSMPFYIGLHHSRQYGIYLDNTFKSFFNFGASNNRFSSFSAEAGVMKYYFMSAPSVGELIAQYTWLTGRIPLPPRWSLGYQQCRYSYYPDKEVLSTARTFREKEIPADAIVMDIHYMDQYKIFTWDKKRFPDPLSLIRQIKELGFEITLMCDPGIKTEPGYEPYDDGVRKDVFAKYPDGQYYTGQVWPGWCYFPDFTNPRTREWWKEKLKAYTDLGVEGYWNDMNEIATWGNMIPENIEFDLDGRKSTTREARNIYGFQMARSTYEGAMSLLTNRRIFNLTRSGFSGVQRYSAVWTGDNVSYDEHMMLGIRLVNSLGLTGVAFAGYDVGGFVGEASTKLFARWISIGALSPFFRGHTMINSKDSEPWSFGEEVEQIARNYIRFRYQLMPYLYSLFHEASLTGMPVQRSLAISYGHDWRVYQGHSQQQYLFGPFIMVAPAESNKQFLKIFFPPGDWYSLFDGSRIKGDQELILECPIHRLPVFVHGGALLPMQRPVQNTKEHVDELILHVYEGANPSSFLFYDDDGATLDYKNGAFARRTIQYLPAERKILLSTADGSYQSHYRTLKLMLHGFDSLGQIMSNGHSVEVKADVHSFFLPLEKYDPIHDPDSMGEEQIQHVTVPYVSSEISISW